jgi:preprotein translocase subunit SecF
MLSGTYSSIFIATPVLADLKERQPQYQALAKRVAVRASGGRAAKRGTARAEAAGRGRPGGTAAGLSSAQLAEEEQDDAGFTEIDGSDPTADELTTTASRAPGAQASRGAPGNARPGPRQQPRRGGSSASRHRPAAEEAALADDLHRPGR